MAKQICLSCFVVAALFNCAVSFAPNQNNHRGLSVLKAESGRRDLLENLAKTLGMGAIAAVSANQSSGSDYELLAKLKNPAQDSWKGKVGATIFIQLNVRGHLLDDSLKTFSYPNLLVQGAVLCTWKGNA